MWETLSSGHIGERDFQILRFHLILKKMPIEECDVRQMIAEEEATSWCLCECIRVRELAATHRLGRMHRLRMLEEQKACNREAGFDRIEITAEMDAQRFRTGFDLKPFYMKLYNPRWPHTPAEYKLEMYVEVKGLRLESILLQPTPPPQCVSTPRRLPAVGTGSDEPGVSRAKSQSTERELNFRLQASLDGGFHVSCTSLEQEGTTILH